MMKGLITHLTQTRFPSLIALRGQGSRQRATHFEPTLRQETDNNLIMTGEESASSFLGSVQQVPRVPNGG